MDPDQPPSEDTSEVYRETGATVMEPSRRRSCAIMASRRAAHVARWRGNKMGAILQAVGIGMLVMLVGTIPRNIMFAANLRHQPSVPWAVPMTAVYLWAFWWYLKGGGPPDSTSEIRRTSLRANRLSGRIWAWALLAGGLGLVA